MTKFNSFAQCGRPALTVAAVLFFSGANAWANCKPHKITSAVQIRSDKVQLWVPEGNKIVPQKDQKPLTKQELERMLPITFMDCGDKDYFFWKPDGKPPVMVKKMKFTCIVISSSGDQSMPAGGSGSGASNNSCS